LPLLELKLLLPELPEFELRLELVELLLELLPELLRLELPLELREELVERLPELELREEEDE
jgi:hypothetical protein